MKTNAFLISLYIPIMAFAVSEGDLRLRNASAAQTDPSSSERKMNKLPTASDQTENEADRSITQRIRQAVVKDDSLSTSAQNVTIVTIDGKVTLRGTVKSANDKQKIAEKDHTVTSVTKVDNQIAVKK